jgi:putative peptide zinc metalloprotease protein
VRTFSENWYRVASLRVALRPSVRVHRQSFRGEDWHLVADPIANRFFRFRPEAYAFVARLTPARTVEEVWTEMLAARPETAPGQEEVVQLLSQLHHADLLYFRNPADNVGFFERIRRREGQERRQKLLGILFARLPLFDPDALLVRMMPAIRTIVGPLGFLVWVAVVAAGVRAALAEAPALADRFQGVLAPSNLPLLFTGLILLKIVHETGHAIVCRRFGAPVHTIGVMFVLLMPMPYVDASASWQLRDRWQRALVASAGMLAELFVAALAAIVWGEAGDGALRALAYNVMLSASVSTLVFNLNPLLRFDGYYILSDALDIPNLYDRARRMLVYGLERFAFGLPDARSPIEAPGEAAWLVLYGVLSQVYRIVVFVGIVVTVSDQFLLLGLVMAALGAVMWGVVPLAKSVRYLLTDERLAMRRPRAILVTVLILGALATAATAVPLPNGLRASGIVEARNHQPVFVGAAGVLTEILVAPGTRVESGTVLARLSNPDLTFDVRVVTAQLREAEAMIDRARADAIADLEPLRRRAATLAQRLDDLNARRAALTITARQPGVWAAPDLRERVGTWIERGSALGGLYDVEGWRFVAVVTQEESADLFDGRTSHGTVRLRGRAAVDLPVVRMEIVPYEQRELPSATLGWLGGGTIATADDRQGGGRTAREGFFELRADLDAIAAQAAMQHGRSGVLRLERPAEPLVAQAARIVGQLFQARLRR